MAIDPQLTSFMPHTVTIAPYASYNNYGEETFSGSTRTASAYVEPGDQMDRGDQINEKTRSTVAHVADTSITLKDKITLPDGTTPEIGTVETYSFVEGLEHTKVVFL